MLTVLPQPPEDRDEENDNSIGLRLQYGKFSVLLTGDSEADERQWWIGHIPELIRDCTILKLAHHGSRNGTDARWLDLVQPELAVASLGTGNDYGHPHSETSALLARTRSRCCAPTSAARSRRERRPHLEPGQPPARPPPGIG